MDFCGYAYPRKQNSVVHTKVESRYLYFNFRKGKNPRIQGHAHLGTFMEIPQSCYSRKQAGCHCDGAHFFGKLMWKLPFSLGI